MAHEEPAKIPKVMLNGGARPPACTSTMGAGDGNRTRTIGLGICTIRASTRPDLRGGLSVSYRERPLFTEVNGPLSGGVNPACRASVDIDGGADGQGRRAARDHRPRPDRFVE